MGGAVMAAGEGLSALGSNPAGLAGLRGIEFMAGTSVDSQNTQIPAIEYWQYDWNERYASTAVGYRVSGVALDHAAAAARVRAGPQTFVAALSWRRGLDLLGPYSFSTTRYAPRVGGYIPPDTYFSGELDGDEEYTFDRPGTLNVMTASVAFRLLRHVDFGCSVNVRKGRARDYGNLDFSYNLSDSGEVLLSWEGFDRTAKQYSFSGGTNLEFGLLWKWRFMAVAATFQTAIHLHTSYTFQNDSAWTYSFGQTVEDHGTGSWDYVIRWPAQLGLGLALKPGRGWTISAEYRGSDGGGNTGDWIIPNFFDQIRAGAEYRFVFGALTLPVRAGGFFIKFDQYSNYNRGWLSGICFGTGLDLGRLTLDAGVLVHSRTWGSYYVELGPYKRSAWNVTMTVSYHLGETGK
jgi:hypothetical protein